jgi:TolB protein
VLILALYQNGYTHLFAYHPAYLPLTRLTFGPFDDITPAISPDGLQVAFASNRSGFWDIYLLDLTTGEITPFTNTPQYEASPTWSPDGKWLAYETYVDDNLEIFIQATFEDSPPIRLTNHPAADTSPVWSPLGRQIAFISLRDGQADTWLIDLDLGPEEGFRNLSKTPNAREAHPAWSPDGRFLTWSQVEDGVHQLMLWDAQAAEQPAKVIGTGDWPIWDPLGGQIAAGLSLANKDYLTAYSTSHPELAWPALPLPGSLEGLSWAPDPLPVPLPEPLTAAAEFTPTPAWTPALSSATDLPPGRLMAVTLEDVQAPYPMLNDRVDEAFRALREQVIARTGWDVLSSLENAYVPLTSPLPPGMGNDWLYTGRAFALDPLVLNAGWMVVVREDFGVETYWRVYVRARQQDGSLGRPLLHQPWDFNARFSGDSFAYEAGGGLAEEIPSGYWVDFTQIAQAIGWERLPALKNWRSYLPGARYNEFAFRDGLDWSAAMAELFPPEALITPTPVPSTPEP